MIKQLDWDPQSVDSDLVPLKSEMQKMGLTVMAYAKGDAIKNNPAEIRKYKKEHGRVYLESKKIKNNLKAVFDTAYKCQYLQEVYERALNIKSARIRR